MLIAVRHGSTALNSAEGEKSRGWLPVGLSHQGMNEMADTADTLSGVEGIRGVHSSDLPRAVQSAHEIGRTIGMEISPTDKLRDWNVGDLTGQPIKQILPYTHALIDRPDVPAPGGESYNDFLGRVVPFLRQLVETPEAHIAVVHNRITTLLHALSMNSGQYPDGDALKHKGPVDPSGLMILDPQWNIRGMYKQSDMTDDMGPQPGFQLPEAR
jgi:broad specificity phosphatase PhoE